MKKVLRIILILLALVVVAALGLYLAQRTTPEGPGSEETTTPDELFVLTGTIQGIYGGTIDIETIHPDDIYKENDAEKRTELRFVRFNSNTELVALDRTNPQEDGTPTEITIVAQDLEVGNAIKVWSETNIRELRTFDASRIEVIQ